MNSLCRVESPVCVIFPGYITTDKLPIAKFKVEEFEQFANVTQEFFLQVYSMKKGLMGNLQ